MIQPLLPKIVSVIRSLIVSDSAKAILIMEIWEDLLETEVSILAPHLKIVAELCLEVSSKKDLDDEIRVKALNFLAVLARLKKKVYILILCLQH